MRAKFIGNGNGDPDGVTVGGVWFPKGEAAEIPESWEAKVRGNSHFEIVKGRPPKKAKADDENGA
jgi:hypothetical protein